MLNKDQRITNQAEIDEETLGDAPEFSIEEDDIVDVKSEFGIDIKPFESRNKDRYLHLEKKAMADYLDGLNIQTINGKKKLIRTQESIAARLAHWGWKTKTGAAVGQSAVSNFLRDYGYRKYSKRKPKVEAKGEPKQIPLRRVAPTPAPPPATVMREKEVAAPDSWRTHVLSVLNGKFPEDMQAGIVLMLAQRAVDDLKRAQATQ